MNKKNIFLTFGLALGLGVSLIVGLAPQKEAVKVNAGGGTLEWHTFYVALDDTYIAGKNYENLVIRSNVDTGNGGHGWQNGVGEAISDDRYEGYTVYELQYAEDWGGYNTFQIQILDGTTWKEQKEIHSGSWSTASYEGKIYYYEGTKGGTWETYTPLVSYGIHGYIVLDGTKQSNDVINETKRSGASYSAPASPTLQNLQHFGGWFDDEACSEGHEFISTTITADLTIYAKVTTMTVDSYIYFAMNSASSVFNNDNAYVTFFGEYTADVQLSTLKISDVLFLNSEGKIYKIPMPSFGNYKFYIHSPKGESNLYQTEDVTPVLTKCMYTWYHNTGDNNNNDYYSWNFSNDATEACAFLESAEYLREHVTPVSGKILQYSVCGIEPSDAAELYEAYEGLGTNALSMVNNSYTYTYNGKYDGVTVPGEDNIKYEKIMEQIYEIALRDADFAKDHPASGRIISIFGGVDTNTSSVLLIVVGALALVSVGGFLVFRKREN